MSPTAHDDRRARSLAGTGTVLLALPLVAPLLLGALRLAQSGHLVVDYLMPFELFPVTLVGAGLVTWASVRSRRRRGLVLGSVVAEVVLLGGGLLAANATGLASGERVAEGWRLALVATAVGGALVALVVLAVAGALLWRDLRDLGTFSPTGTG